MATQNFRVKNGLEVGIGATILIAKETGNVGIGTDNTVDQLTLGSPTNQLLGFETDNEPTIQSYNANLHINTAGNNVLFDGNGSSVGIGTTNPSTKLTVYSSNSSSDEREIRIDASDAPAGANSLGLFRIIGDQSAAGKYLIGYNSTHTSQANELSLKNADGSITFHTANTEKLRITSSGNVGIATIAPSQTLDVNGNARFRGAIYDNNNVVGVANSILISTGSGVVWADITNIPVGDATTLDGLDSTQFLRSDVADTKVGVTTFQDDATFQSNVYLGDNDVLNFGDGNDLQISHSGGASLIQDTGSGSLFVETDGGGIRLRKISGSENLANFYVDGAVELYYDNSKKLETTGIGVSISNGVSDTATIAGPANLIIDPGTVGDDTGVVRIKGDLYVDGTTTQINSTTIELADFIVGIATTATTDLLADGAGINIGPDNTFLYEYNSGTNPSLKSSENLNVASGKHYQIDQIERLSANTLSLGTGTTIHSPASNTLTFGTNGTGRLFIDASGKISNDNAGNNPAQLNVVGKIAAGTTSYGATPTLFGDYNFITETYDDTRYLAWMQRRSSNARAWIGAVGVGNFTADLIFGTNGLTSDSAATEKMRIHRSGNVGIGLTNPTSKVHVYGNGAEVFVKQDSGIAGSAGFKVFAAGTDSPNNASYYTMNAGSIWGQTGGGGIYFGPENRSSIQLFLRTSNGQLGIGTDGPSQKLDVNGNIRIRGSIYDSLNNVGSTNQVLVSNAGAGVTWTDITSIPGVGAGITATDVTVADESTDTTCFPLFVTAATGNLPPKSGSNLTFNSATGVLGATTFSGSGASLTNLNASNISTGTLSDDRLGTIDNANLVALSALDIDGGTETTTLADADLLIVDDGANGTNRKITAANAKTYFTTGVGAGITATDVTVADESTDTTCFPLFVTAATGNLPPKSGSNLTFNSATGALGATTLISDVATGTAPLTVNSTTVVTNLNVDQVDGLDASQFLRSDASDTTTGDITISKTSPKLILNDTNTTTGSYPAIQFDTNNNQGVLLEHNELDGELPVAGYGLILKQSPNNGQFPSTGTLTFTVLGQIYTGSATTSSTSRVLTTADEGSGNGLDADTLDGQEGSYYRNATNINAGTLSDDRLGTIDNANLVALSALDIDGGTATTTLADVDLFIVDDGANGTNRKITASDAKTYFTAGVGAGITATDVTVADESTDTTCFPLFVTAATGNLPPKSGSNLTFNSATGALGATTFVGNLNNTLTLNTSGTGISGSTTYNNSGASTFTVTSNATNANTGGTIVARDGSGDFSANTITLAGQLNGPANFIIDPATVGDNTGVVRIKGDLYVDGTNFIVDSETITLADFVVGIASTATTDALTDGAGIQIGPDNTFLYEYNGGTNPSLKSSENLNVASGKHYQIGETEVLNATTLGSGVVNSSLTSLGTIVTGVWQGTAINDDYIGTIDNANKVSLTALNIDGGTATTTLADVDLFIVDDGANGTNRKITASDAKTYFTAGVGGGGGSSDGVDFNTGITTTKYAPAADDIDGFTAIAVTFPSTAGRTYLVESIHVTNVSAGDLYITSRIDYNGGENVPFTNKVLIPEQGAIDIIDESIICNPSDNIRLAAYNGIGVTASGVLNGLDCFVTYVEKIDTDYIGIGSTTKSSFADETVFTSNTNPSVINTITLTNNSDVADLDASVSMFRGGTIRQGYFVYNLTIPQNSSVQILPKAKRLNATDTIVVRSSSTALGINVAGKYIT